MAWCKNCSNVTFYLTVLLLYHLTQCTSSKLFPKLILISMDGFRYNYLDMFSSDEIPNFRYIIENGVKAESMLNVFPSVTYPNHYTLITGLYPESHGIVHNRFYDPVWKEYFFYDNRRDNFDPIWFDVGAEPIYVTNKKADASRCAGSVVWPCGLGKVKGIGPDKIIPDADPFSVIDFKTRVDTLVSWFTEKINPINLGLLYFPEPDEIAHHSGAGSENVTRFIKGELNDVLGHLFQRLKESNLFDEMNIILTADHGFTNYTKAIVLAEYGLNSTLYSTGSKFFKNHLAVNIFPNEGKEEIVYNTLKNISELYVYRKHDKDLVNIHYSDNIRVAPIVITAKEGYAIFPDDASKNDYKTIGVHGYNPAQVMNMRPFFLAMGPAFKKGFSLKSLNNVDIYPLMCYILGLTPAPNNGSLENVKDMLVEKSITDEFHLSLTGVSFLFIVGVSVTLAALYSICACHNARKKTRLLYHRKNRASGVTSLTSPVHQLLNNDDDDDDEF
ncbi:hypothetical protein ACF0H5_007936 [Mactra antiquata]